MITDTEIRVKGVEALIIALGEVQAERFISLILREPFDYSQWQQNLWPGQTVAQISSMAMAGRSGNR
jgi:hypothetical protein